MKNRIYVKPVKDLVIRYERSPFSKLSATGGWVPASKYWQRHVRSGDVVQAAPPAPVENGS